MIILNQVRSRQTILFFHFMNHAVVWRQITVLYMILNNFFVKLKGTNAEFLYGLRMRVLQLDPMMQVCADYTNYIMKKHDRGDVRMEWKFIQQFAFVTYYCKNSANQAPVPLTIFEMLLFISYLTNHNETLHMSRKYNCRDLCKIAL